MPLIYPGLIKLRTNKVLGLNDQLFPQNKIPNFVPTLEIIIAAVVFVVLLLMVLCYCCLTQGQS